MNREKERKLITDALTALTSDDRLVETPIVNFFGLPGIGKSRLLDEIISLCDPQQVHWLKLDAGADIPVFSATVVQRIRRYVPEVERPASLQASLALLKMVLETSSLVLLVDNIESTDEQQLYSVECILEKLILYNNIFIVLASQGELSFHRQRKIQRKLTPHALSLLDKALSQQYFLTHLPSVTEVQQERLFTWTQGHPLAMQELIQVLHEHNSLADERVHPQLLQHLLDVLLIRRLYEQVPEEQEWFETMLRLLAVPRRFNVIFIRLLVERFAPESYRLSSGVEYVKLPQKIGQVTGVLQWKRELAGFTLEEPVRTLLLFQLKMQFAERYHALNLFLAELNWQYARGTEHIGDRVQYEKEFVYHHLVNVERDGRVAAATTALQQIFTLAAGEQTQLLHFQDELFADRGLQEEPGEDFAPLRQHLYQEIAGSLYRSYQTAGPDSQGQAFDTLFRYLRTIQERDRVLREAMITDYLDRIGTERNSRWLLERYRGLEEADSNGL
jgi:hypothetical protein